MATCKGRKNDGTPCQSTILLANGYCRAHQDQATQSYRWSRERLENAIAANGGPEGLDLAGDDLSDLDLSAMDLRGIILGKYVKELHLLLIADLTDTQFVDADLRKALLVGCDLTWTALVGADLTKAHFNYADLRGAELWSATLEGATFWWASLQGADLHFANLAKADLRRADLTNLDLLDTQNLAGIKLHRAELSNTRLERKQLGPALGDELAGEYPEARYAYLALKQNFEGLGDYDAASWSYIKERQMEKACNAPRRARRIYGPHELGDRPGFLGGSNLPGYHPKVWWFFVKHTWKWLTDWLVELICGYGERPWRTLVTMGVVFAVFLGVYWLSWAVVRVDPMPGGTPVPTRKLQDLIVFGLGAFTTMDPKGLEPRALWVQIVVAIEALLGIGLTGLLGFVVGNRIRRS